MKIHLCGILVGSILLVGCDESGEPAALERDDTTSERAASRAEPDGAQSRGAMDELGERGDAGTAAVDPWNSALDEVTAPPDTAEGFGCPNDSKCHKHCKSVGFDGGYCEGFLDLRCQCYWL